MTDSEIIAWLDQSRDRLQDVYWHMENEGGTVRDAVQDLSRPVEETFVPVDARRAVGCLGCERDAQGKDSQDMHTCRGWS